MSTTRVMRLGVALAVGSLALTGCHSNGNNPQPSTRPPSHSRAPSPAQAAAADATAAYQRMWDAFVEAAKVPNPDAPDIRRYASGDALKLIVGVLQADLTQGKIAKGPLVTHPTVTDLKPADDPTSVTVTDCVDATNWLEYNKKTGQLWDNQPGGRHHNTATVTRTEGAWKVSAFTLEVKGTC